jgi:hypothetical protein
MSLTPSDLESEPRSAYLVINAGSTKRSGGSLSTDRRPARLAPFPEDLRSWK